MFLGRRVRVICKVQSGAGYLYRILGEVFQTVYHRLGEFKLGSLWIDASGNSFVCFGEEGVLTTVLETQTDVGD
jgi:hypothetical protein